jgi:hypothetical protein
MLYNLENFSTSVLVSQIFKILFINKEHEMILALQSRSHID